MEGLFIARNLRSDENSKRNIFLALHIICPQMRTPTNILSTMERTHPKFSITPTLQSIKTKYFQFHTI